MQNWFLCSASGNGKFVIYTFSQAFPLHQLKKKTVLFGVLVYWRYIEASAACKIIEARPGRSSLGNVVEMLQTWMCLWLNLSPGYPSKSARTASLHNKIQNCARKLFYSILYFIRSKTLEQIFLKCYFFLVFCWWPFKVDKMDIPILNVQG